MKKSSKPKAPPIFLVKMIMGLLNFLEKFQRKLMPPEAILLGHAMRDVVVFRSVYVAAELKIADLLKDGPKSAEQLAKETDTNADALYRIMRTLSSIGIFKAKKGRQFELAKIGKHLQSGVEESMLFFVKICGSEFISNIWGDLLQSVKNGKSYYENNYNMSFFDWLEKNPERRKEFDVGMAGVSAYTDIPIAAGYDFSSFGTLADIGGGRGTQIVTILSAFPRLKGILFELPLTIGILEKENIVQQDGLDGRLKLVSGDFFKSVPPGCDAYFMKSIIHDWDDERSIKILSNCRRAMRQDSKLLLAEHIVRGDSNEPDFFKFLDVNILALIGGCVRTKEEYSRLLERSGFKLNRVVTTASPFFIIEAKPF
jgi:predicted transcriptional regulator